MFRHKTISAVGAIMGGLVLSAGALAISDKWAIHDENRPMSPVVTPGQKYGDPPSDAIVLFDGKDLSQFIGAEGSPAKWNVENGYMEVNGTGDIQTRQAFGDVQMHIEWMAPDPPSGASQKRGNSGIFFMGKYEVQVLDSYESKTYADGQAAALYGQYPPLVNACRPPGQWQTYDIVFRAPVFDGGNLVRPARVTVIHNGVVVQDAAEYTGPSGHKRRPPYEAHGELPFRLQDHKDNQPVRFRNIWVRKLGQVE